MRGRKRVKMESSSAASGHTAQNRLVRDTVFGEPAVNGEEVLLGRIQQDQVRGSGVGNRAGQSRTDKTARASQQNRNHEALSTTISV